MSLSCDGSDAGPDRGGNTSHLMHSDTSSRKFPAVPRSSDLMPQAALAVIQPTVPPVVPPVVPFVASR